ncbi:MAG: UDP-N-acetylglucosamine 2-epimerase, partial [Actinomycetota bacterium]|nr:UDP-N-acetylglucosamine 2-epimerase [Actinomycetota bacterium]
HGDRVEALAGALAGSLTNTRVAHVEGGEVSGTIDDAIRHSLSKHAHVHFVANEQARARLLQLGEEADRVLVVGSPEADALAVAAGSDLTPVREHYGTPAPPYGVLVLHPVTTELELNRRHAEAVVDGCSPPGAPGWSLTPTTTRALTTCGRRSSVWTAARRSSGCRPCGSRPNLSLVRHAEVVVGNSSSGVREAPVLGTPSVDVGSRQADRSPAASVRHVPAVAGEVAGAIRAARAGGRSRPEEPFGSVGAAGRIVAAVCTDHVWALDLQKRFVDRPLAEQ